MSEYQYYEFIAVDRTLNADQQAELRELSTRAVITSTSFVNEYHWGSFRGSPDRMMDRYFDAHLYLANWGSRRVVLRLPKKLLRVDTVERYLLDEHVQARSVGKHLVIDLRSEDEECDWNHDAESWLPAIVGVRGELATGDLRPLYLAWLAGYGSWERDEWAFDRDHDDEPEPPVPAGLGMLTGPQRALADFLRLDENLLHVAAAASAPLPPVVDDPGAQGRWIASLAVEEKDRLLARVVGDEAALVRMELWQRFRGGVVDQPSTASTRTVADLLDGVARYRAERE